MSEKMGRVKSDETVDWAVLLHALEHVARPKLVQEDYDV